jgi:hypothetical protein
MRPAIASRPGHFGLAMAAVSQQQRIILTWWAVALSLGLLQVGRSLQSMNPDGVSYLDLGDAYARGDWQAAFNAYWSPLYAWLLTSVLLLTHASPRWEFPIVHVVNFGIYLIALASFTFLLHELIAYQRGYVAAAYRGRQCTLPEWAWISLGYGIFVWCTLRYLPLGLVTPDLLVSAFVYAICAVLLRLRRGRASPLALACLGALLGLGYLAKAPMLPLAAVFAFVALIAVRDIRNNFPKIAIVLGVAAIIVTPYVTALSLTRGRLTFGDSARLNYAWLVNGVQADVHWQGGAGDSGVPVHPTRMILADPPVYEFATPLTATYAAWYDPSYWYEGVVLHFDARQQLQAVLRASAVYRDIVLRLSGLLVGAAILVATSAVAWRKLVRAVDPEVILGIPAVAAFGMFALVYVEPRHIAPFVVLAVLAVLALVGGPPTDWRARFIGRASAVLVVVLGLLIATVAFGDVARPSGPGVGDGTPPVKDQTHLEVAQDLGAFGVGPGDEVANVGFSFEAYWARLARVRIVAEAPGPQTESLIANNATVRETVMRTLFQTGAKAIVAQNWPAALSNEGWRQVGDTSFYILVRPNS